MARISELLKIMITTEKVDFGSYSHFTENIDDYEKDILYKICKYDPPAPLNGSRDLHHAVIHYQKVTYHVYYKHYQVIGFDKKGRPSSNLISVLLRRPLSAENTEILNKRLDSILHDLDKHKGHFTIFKHYSVIFAHNTTSKFKPNAALIKKSAKFLVFGVIGLMLFLLFINLDKQEELKKHSQIITSFEEKSFFDSIDLFKTSLNKSDYSTEINRIILRKGNEIAVSITTIAEYRNFLKSFNTKSQDPSPVLETLRSTPLYSRELENKILFFSKIEKEYVSVRDSRNVSKIKKFLKKNSSYLTEQDKLVLRGIAEELTK